MEQNLLILNSKQDQQINLELQTQINLMDLLNQHIQEEVINQELELLQLVDQVHIKVVMVDKLTYKDNLGHLEFQEVHLLVELLLLLPDTNQEQVLLEPHHLFLDQEQVQARVLHINRELIINLEQDTNLVQVINLEQDTNLDQAINLEQVFLA